MSGGGKPHSIDDDLAAIRQQRSIDDDLAAIRAQGATPTPHVPYRDKPEPAKAPSVLSDIGGAAMDALNLPPGIRSIASRAVTHPLETSISVGQGVPGGKLAQAGFAMLGSRLPGMSSTGPMTYADALASLDQETKDQPLAMRLASKIPGAVVTGSALPALRGMGQISAAGAGLSAADRALAATDEPLADRLKGTAISAAIGGVTAPIISKGLDLANTGIRAIRAPNANANIDAQKAARDLVAKQNYSGSLAEGAANEPTAAIGAALQRPRIQPIVENIKGLDAYATMDPRDPRFLDQVFKELASQSVDIENALESPTVRDQASKALRLRALNEDKQALLRAMESPGEVVTPAVAAEVPGITTAQSPAPTTREALAAFQDRQAAAARRSMSGRTSEQAQVLPAIDRRVAESEAGPITGTPPGPRRIEVTPAITRTQPPMMPSYRSTVGDYAQRTGDIEATAKGIDALNAAKKGVTTGKNAMSDKSDAAILRWLTDPETPQHEITHYLSGLSGATKAQLAKAAGVHSIYDVLGYVGTLGILPAVKSANVLNNSLRMSGGASAVGPRFRASALADLLAAINPR